MILCKRCVSEHTFRKTLREFLAETNFRGGEEGKITLRLSMLRIYLRRVFRDFGRKNKDEFNIQTNLRNAFNRS
jgi:hypothetical protein